MELTSEQLAIVNHDYGPARVFAVAGAGKTTAMVHRIRRLVRDKVFAPERILASSFSRATVSDLELRLSPWPECQRVKTQTLHSLGNRIIKQAWSRGYLARPHSSLAPEKVDRELCKQAFKEARHQNLYFKADLDTLDQEDFLSYISRCKGRLRYANLEVVHFPDNSPHRGVAQPADPPAEKTLSWYLDLYRLFESIRQRQGWISFDDMLMTGWQLLVQCPDLLEDLRQQFDCIIVDEFQDVNRAQFGILDLLMRPHRNYMVVGDDDQTIYEWRGADNKFILKDFERYGPTDFTIMDNFRCQASQITLANAVIRQNQNRYAKQLNLTQGFEGCTRIHHVPTSDHLGSKIAERIAQAIEQGLPINEIAILVRVYAQTPYIEQHLIQRGIPYWGADLVPFFRRAEILDFLVFAEAALADREEHSSVSSTVQWERIKRVPPIRYLSKELKQEMELKLSTTSAPLSQILLGVGPRIPNTRTAQTVASLAEWMMAMKEQKPAKFSLEWLESCVGYRESLKRSSGAQHSGEGKVAGIEALIQYSEDKGSLAEFLDHLDLLQDWVDKQSKDPDRCVCLTTIHQSKGLEWSTVIIPHCNEGTIPFGENLDRNELEQERRLLYVAMTRAKQKLHLYCLGSQPISQFLDKAKSEEILSKTEQIQQCLKKDPQEWKADNVLSFIRSVQELRLERYFRQWWREQEHNKRLIANTIQRFFMAATEAQLLRHISLEKSSIDLWKEISPLGHISSPVDFPGLDVLLRHSNRSHSHSSPSVASLVGSLKVNDWVEHKSFGKGKIMKIEVKKSNSEEIITIDFRSHGSKRIMISKQFCALSLAQS